MFVVLARPFTEWKPETADHIMLITLLMLICTCTGAWPTETNTTQVATNASNGDFGRLDIPLSFQITLRRTHRTYWLPDLPKAVTAKFEYSLSKKYSSQNKARLVSLNGQEPLPNPLPLQLEYDGGHEVRFTSTPSTGEKITLPDGQNVNIDFVYLDVKLDVPQKRFAQVVLGEHNSREIYESVKSNGQDSSTDDTIRTDAE